jgi:hypothetical protein
MEAQSRELLGAYLRGAPPSHSDGTRWATIAEISAQKPALAAVDSVLAMRMEAFSAAVDARRHRRGDSRMISPFAVVRQRLSSLCGTDGRRILAFRRQVAEYQMAIRTHDLEAVVSGRRLNVEALQRRPGFAFV